jgi:hypothetical protein
MGTKRMLGREAASQIGAASAASFCHARRRADTGATNFGTISRTVWPWAWNSRAQWCAPEQASNADQARGQPTPAPWPSARRPGNGFVMFSSKETNYYLAARLMTAIAVPRRRVAYALVQASWEARVPEQHRRYIEEALAEYKVSLESEVDPEHWINDQLLAGELERRLGQFDTASSRFTALLADPRTMKEIHIRIARFQLELIARRDSRSQLVPQPLK